MTASPMAKLNADDPGSAAVRSAGGQDRYRRSQGTGLIFLVYARHAAFFLILVLIIDTWLVTGIIYPIRVAGPSMMPSLGGPRFEMACPQCGCPLCWCAVTQALADCLERAACPNCGARLAQLTFGGKPYQPEPDVRPGDRVVILKGLWRSWKRWDTVAFYNAGEHGGLTVKRIVGLPGEKIEIRHGVLWADGHLQPRPWEVQRSMCVPVYLPRGFEDSVIQLEPTSSLSRWDVEPPYYPATTYCHFHPALDQYEKPTRNLILCFAVEGFSPGTRLHIRSRFGSGYVDATLTLPSEFTLRCFDESFDAIPPGGEQISGKLPPLPAKSEFAVSLVDQHFLLVVNDSVIAETSYAAKPLSQSIQRPFEVTVEGGSVTIRNLGLWKVSCYDDEHRFPDSLAGYYVLGDDPHVSLDSRHFGIISSDRVIGRVITWPFEGSGTRARTLPYGKTNQTDKSPRGGR